MEILICKDSDINRDKFVSLNNVLREYSDMKQEIKHSQRIISDNA